MAIANRRIACFASAIALSHSVKFSLDLLSRLLIILSMADSSKIYLRKAYKAAKRELNELLAQQQKLEKQLVVVRQSLQSLASMCQAAGMEVEPSSDAVYLLLKSALGDEIRSILTANYPAWMRPNHIKNELQRIGHDLKKYSNPQAAIQMVLKRMVESGEAQETHSPEDGKKVYRIPRTQTDIATPYKNVQVAALGARLGWTDYVFDPAELPEEVASVVGAPKTKKRSLGARLRMDDEK